MSMTKRIYAIHNAGRTVGLVRAASPAQALCHHTAGMYTVGVASQDELVAALNAGISVAEAGREAAGAEPAASDDEQPEASS